MSTDLVNKSPTTISQREYGGILFITWIAAINETQNFLHNSGSDEVNTLLLGIGSTVWIVASVALWGGILALGVGFFGMNLVFS